VIAMAMEAPRLVTIATGAALGAAILLLALNRTEFLKITAGPAETISGTSRSSEEENQDGRDQKENRKQHRSG
jgi:hypothetical protein